MWRYFELVSDRIIHDDADEAIPDEDVIYQITTFGADFTVDGWTTDSKRLSLPGRVDSKTLNCRWSSEAYDVTFLYDREI